MRPAAALSLTILSLLAGVVFLYSAYTKLFPIQTFEYTMVEFGHLPWLAAAVAARLIVGLEAVLGLLLVLQLYGRKKGVVKAALLLTLGFSAYLAFLWATAGNQVNCGCFGDAIWMSPAASLIKNGLLTAALVLLLRYHNGLQTKGAALFLPGGFMAASIVLFILFPLPDRQPSWLQQDRFRPDLSKLYAPGKTDKPGVALQQGKHILACFTLTCPHCRMAARKLRLMKERNPALPFYMVLAGSDDHLQPFFEDTKATNIPYTRLRGQAFIDLAGVAYPAIYWMDNGWVVAKANYITLDQEAIERWLAGQ